VLVLLDDGNVELVLGLLGSEGVVELVWALVDPVVPYVELVPALP
jgi:hypothetical protein